MLIRTVTMAVALAGGTVSAQEFPLEIATKFGPAEIETRPERVATVDYAGVDNVLALGARPLTARAWFGPYKDALWPWARELAESEPVVVGSTLDFEAIAATAPDVILALRSGITEAEHEKLSSIAPVVAVPPERGDYSLDWREQARLAGKALGRSERAEELIGEVEDEAAATAEAHPDWQGATFAMLTYYEGALGLYTETDSSVRFLEALGLSVHPRVEELSSPGQFYTEISQEILPEIDADVIFWYAPVGSPEIEGLAVRDVMDAPAEGREIFLPQDSRVNGALSHGSLLSLPVAIDALTPMLEAALDGDPATEVPGG